MNSYLCRLTVLIVGAAAALPAGARGGEANWPQWRGPHFDGSSGATNLPDTFSKDKNLLWSTTLPGVGNGTPIVWGDRAFVSTIDAQSRKLRGVCVGLKDGKVLWEKEIGVGFRENNRNNAASPSAVTDGKLVTFFFATGDLAAFDLDGKPAWTRDLQKDHGSFNFMWIYGSSPLLYKGKLYVEVLHRDTPYGGERGGSGGEGKSGDSFLLAIDPQTGKDLWKHVRPTDARGESREAYTTPIPVEVNGHSQVVLVGGDAVTGHDADTGAELWRYTGWNPPAAYRQDFRMVPSVSAGEGIVVACAPKGGPVMAIKADSKGKVADADLAWKSTALTSDVCVPLFYDHKLYILNGDKRNTLSCVDPKTGEAKWTGSLGGRSVFRASPTGADGKIYCMNENGDVAVVAASADEFKLRSQTSLGGNPSRASVVAVDNAILVRAGDVLYAFGEKK